MPRHPCGPPVRIGWAAYLLHGDVFMKQFDHEAGATYPDLGCNCEFYTEPGFLEVESLGPLRRLAQTSATTRTISNKA